MRHAKCISMFLALATLAAFVSCGSGAEEKPTVTTEGVDTTVTVGDNTEETRLEPDLPDVRYDGKTLRFLSRTSTDKVVRYYSEVRSDEENGETMNDWTSEDVKGFGKIFGNQNKIYYKVNEKLK